MNELDNGDFYYDPKMVTHLTKEHVGTEEFNITIHMLGGVNIYWECVSKEMLNELLQAIQIAKEGES